MLIVVFLMIIFFGFGKLQNFTGSSSNATIQPTASENVASDNFELFNNQGQSNLVGNSTSIKLLNSTNDSNLLSQAKSLLVRAGFQKITTNQAENPYEKTIINYKKSQISQAQAALEALKPNFEASLQESNDLDKNTDILIIIGAK